MTGTNSQRLQKHYQHARTQRTVHYPLAAKLRGDQIADGDPLGNDGASSKIIRRSNVM